MLTKKQVLEKIKKGESFQGVEIGDVDFSGHIFDKHVNISGALFKGKADFSDTEFKDRGWFGSVDFYHRASFRKSLFHNEASFAGAHFYGDLDFIEAKFQDRAFFMDAQFDNEAYFGRAQFNGDALFWGAKFHKDVSFFSVKFKKKVDFFDATFLDEAIFGMTEFSDASFNDSKFWGITVFTGGRERVEKTTVDDKGNPKIEFVEGKEKRIFSPNHPTYITGVVFQGPSGVKIRKADLSKCFLRNTDLSKVELTDVIFPIKKDPLGRRKVVYDEIANEPKNKDFPFIEKIYRDLKKNYENRGSYGEAGDFHYGEMEMRRLSQKPIFRYISFLWLYKTLSGYGEKHWRALFWLGAFLLVYLGVYRFIEYNSQPLWDGLWNSFVHSLEIVTFQRSHIYPSISPQGKLADMLLTIAFSLQATLAILAIKRKFKR